MDNGIGKVAGRDITLDALRMAFAIIIVFHHLTVNKVIKGFDIGFLGVEFFFIVSGYMMVKSMSKRDESLIDFLKRKLRVFFPYFIVAIIFCVCISFYINCSNGLSISESFYKALLELTNGLMLTSEMTMINGVWWYIPSMLIAIIILFPLVKRYGRTFMAVYAPLIGFALMGIIFATDLSTFGKQSAWLVVAKEGTIRGIAMVSLGVFSYECASRIRSINFNRKETAALALITIFSFVFVFVNIIFFKDIDTGLDRKALEFLLIIFILIGVTLLLSETTHLNYYSDTKWGTKISQTFANGSLLIFLNHAYVIPLVKTFTDDTTLIVVSVWIITIVLSILCYHIGNYIYKACRNIVNRGKAQTGI